MQFQKYQHIERFGTDEVDGIEFGECIVFPKIDGTNGSVWLGDDGEIKAGSRNRELTLDYDNQGFYEYVLHNENIKKYLSDHPKHRLYGEWLVPHSFKQYRMDAWKKFYIFDITVSYEDVVEGFEYIPYDIYQPELEKYGLDYIIPLCKIKNGNYEYFLKALENNFFLVEDGKGYGEGIVIKNYDHYNKYRRQTWAKMVANEFKEKHRREMGVDEIKASLMIEERIVEDFCTPEFIEKEFAKIVNDKDGWRSQYIGELLGRVFHELVKEECWNFVKTYKYPKIDFKTLNALTINKIKRMKPEIFN